MNSRQLVYKTLEFDSPQRIPRNLTVLPWAKNHYPEELNRIQSWFPDDVVNAMGFLKKKPLIIGDPYLPGFFVDEWGCRFENRHAGVYGEVKDPVIKSFDDLDLLREPIELLSVDIEEVNSFCINSDKFVFSGGFVRPFERIQFLRGTENVMMDLAVCPEKVTQLLAKVHEFNIKLFEVWSKTDVDALMIFDDWGSQKSLLISPEMWRNIFKPLYIDYARIAKENGKKLFMHSDGYILDILEDIIDIGVDMLNAQIFCMGFNNLQKYAGKITFWGEIDRQHLLPYGTEQEIIQAVNEICQNLYQNGGGGCSC